MPPPPPEGQLHSDCCGAADETGVAADDGPWDPGADADDPGTSADDPGADADDLGTSADDPGTDADEPGISVVCPGPALVSVTLGPVGASVVLKNGPCVREVGTTLDRVTIVVFKDVWVIVVAFAGVDVLKGRFVIAGFDDT